jgi:hypothetical protein
MKTCALLGAPVVLIFISLSRAIGQQPEDLTAKLDRLRGQISDVNPKVRLLAIEGLNVLGHKGTQGGI